MNKQEHWVERYQEMNTPGETGNHILHEAAKTEAGWLFRVAAQNAEKAGLIDAALTARTLAYLEEEKASRVFDLGKAGERAYTAHGMGLFPESQIHIRNALYRINTAIKDMREHPLTEPDLSIVSTNQTQINDIFYLAGINQEMREQSIPVGSTMGGSDIYNYNTNLGVTVIEFRRGNRTALRVRKKKIPQEAAA